MMESLLSAFMSPWGALFGLSLPAVVVLYLLKLKRKRWTVPSTLLWRQAMEDMTANAPFQKLRTNPLLLLQLLILLLLTLALMRPALSLESLTGVDLYVLLDRSASMAATDVVPNRFEAAKEKIRDQIKSMGQGDRMMIVAFSNHSEVVVPLSSDRGELLAGLEPVDLQETGTRLSEAITILDAAIGEKRDRSKIFLYSDGRIGDTADLFPPAVETQFVAVGKRGENLAITRFSLSAVQGDEAGYQAFLEVSREGNRPEPVTLSLEWEGQAIDAHRFEWTEGETSHSHVFQIPPIENGFLEARIDNTDGLLLDNRVGTEIRSQPPIEVLLVSNGTSFFERILPLIHGVEAHKAGADTYSATVAADVFIFDNWAPAEIPADCGGALFLGAAPPQALHAGWEETPVEFPLVLDWKRTHPVTRGADYRNLQIERSAQVTAPEDAETLLESRETPLLYGLEKGHQRFLIAPFSIHQSNWSRLYSFPITVSNAIRWMAGRTNRAEVARIHKTGEPLEFLGQAGLLRLTIESPRGKLSALELSEGQKSYFAATYLTGQYRILQVDGDTREEVWFNLLDPAESMIAPAESLPFGKEEISAAASAEPQSREVWTWLALAAFGFLIWEWWWYTRQSWV